MKARVWATLPLRLAAYASGRAWPLWCTFAITDRCSSRCRYCTYRSNEGDRLSTDDCRLLVRRVARGGVAHVILSGGEVLLRGDIAEVIVEAKRVGLTIGINTSGIPGSSEVYRRFMDAGLDRLTFSLDAATAAVHDELRPGAPWRSVVRNLEQAVIVRNRHGFTTRIGTTTVLTRGNIQEILSLVALRREAGADWNSFQPVWSRPADRRFRERFGFTESDAGVLQEARSALRTVTNGNLEPYYEILPSLYGITRAPVSRPCFGGRAFVHLDSRGALQPCSPLGISFGSLLAEEASSLLRSQRSLRFFRWADEGGCAGCSMTCYQERNLLLSAALGSPARALHQAMTRYFR